MCDGGRRNSLHPRAALLEFVEQNKTHHNFYFQKLSDHSQVAYEKNGK